MLYHRKFKTLKYGFNYAFRVTLVVFRIIEKVNQKKKISVKEVYSHPTELMTAKFGY